MKGNDIMNKENKRKNKKLKNKLLIVSGISLLTILGGTLAYFTTSTNITNLFKTALYQNRIVEKFISPDNWTPGTTTDKTIEVTNTGSINMAVRAEKWVSNNGNEMSLKDNSDNVVAIINFNDGWTKDSDGYYYYGSKENKTILKSGETTSSFISGVTFNENVKASLKETISSDGHIVTYESTGNGYDNAKYILTIKIDTIQYDQANNVW
jgi:predicted ribosomally synthesized peptide with SipW-like signal peptide